MTSILIVGAGAVGRVYAHHLAAGGARVSVMVRERHAAELRDGVVVRRVRGRGRREDARFVPHEVLVGVESLTGRRFDQVWLALPSDALDEPWIDALIDAIDGATLVTLQPGAHVVQRLGRAHLVRGAIGILAWASPLEGSIDPRERGASPATSYWLPPLSPTAFSGSDAARVRAVTNALRAGGCPARHVKDADAALASTADIIHPIVAVLETHGWSLRALRRGPGLARALAAARTLLAITARQRRTGTPWLAMFLRAPLLSPVVAIAPWVVPFDLERYLAVHFHKVGGQTRALLAEAVDDARTLGIDDAPIAALCADLARVGPGGGSPTE